MPAADMIEVADLRDMRRVLHKLVAGSRMSTATMERIAGLPAGYIPKALASRPLRGLSGNTIFLLVTVLGRKIVLTVDPEAKARIEAHRDYVVATVNQKRFGRRHADRVSIFRKISQKGVAARLEKLTAAERSRVARTAAKARWKRVRAERRASAQIARNAAVADVHAHQLGEPVGHLGDTGGEANALAHGYAQRAGGGLRARREA